MELEREGIFESAEEVGRPLSTPWPTCVFFFFFFFFSGGANQKNSKLQQNDETNSEMSHV